MKAVVFDIDRVPPQFQYPNDYSLVNLLDATYTYFDIGDYLDQLAAVDDRITDVVKELREWQSRYNVHLMGKGPWDELEHIINKIDDREVDDEVHS